MGVLRPSFSYSGWENTGAVMELKGCVFSLYVIKAGVAMVSMLIFDLKNWNRF